MGIDSDEEEEIIDWAMVLGSQAQQEAFEELRQYAMAPRHEIVILALLR
jgi:hypothetical protein